MRRAFANSEVSPIRHLPSPSSMHVWARNTERNHGTVHAPSENQHHPWQPWMGVVGVTCLPSPHHPFYWHKPFAFHGYSTKTPRFSVPKCFRTVWWHHYRTFKPKIPMMPPKPDSLILLMPTPFFPFFPRWYRLPPALFRSFLFQISPIITT